MSTFTFSCKYPCIQVFLLRSRLLVPDTIQKQFPYHFHNTQQKNDMVLDSSLKQGSQRWTNEKQMNLRYLVPSKNKQRNQKTSEQNRQGCVAHLCPPHHISKEAFHGIKASRQNLNIQGIGAAPGYRTRGITWWAEISKPLVEVGSVNTWVGDVVGAGSHSKRLAWGNLKSGRVSPVPWNWSLLEQKCTPPVIVPSEKAAGKIPGS